MEYIELGLMAACMFGVFVMVVGGFGCEVSKKNKKRYTAVAFFGFAIAAVTGFGSILVSTAEIIINFLS